VMIGASSSSYSLELYHALPWTGAAKLPVSYRALESRFRNMRLFYRTRYSTMRASLLTRQKGFPVFPPPNPFAIATSEWEFCVAGLFTTTRSGQVIGNQEAFRRLHTHTHRYR